MIRARGGAGRVTFAPSFWLRNPNLQSILPSLGLRRRTVERRCAPLLAASRELLLDCGAGVRLLGALAQHDDGRCLAVILHGWEGSADSLYVISLGQLLFERGFDVFRLNLRDHGSTHGLNRELFHSCRLDEVAGAVRRIAELFPQHRRGLVGFSLGGNFALRIGASEPRTAETLAGIVAVSPVLDPQNALFALERGWFVYRRYFLAKWRRSLEKKQAAWPQEFDFGALAGMRGLTDMTEHLVLNHTQFADLQSYLRGYAITGDLLSRLKIPSRIFASRDDPIIPAADYAHLAHSDLLEVTITQHGGHCGFREGLRNGLWLENQIHAQLNRYFARRRG